VALTGAHTPARAQMLDCMIQPHQIVQVGAPTAGVVESVLVERGDLVLRGQVLVQLQAHVERAALALARERSAQAGEVRSATSARVLAERELQRAKELAGDNFVSPTYVDRARAEAEVAGGRTDQAQERRRTAARELELAQAQLAQRTIRSPISGVVVDRFMSPGEFVEQKPLLRVATIDPLRVDVLVPAVAFGQVQIGMRGRVVPEMAGHGTHEAVVKSVDRVIDAASNTFRVRLELPNPNSALPAGLRCKVELALKRPAGAVAPAPAPSVPATPAASQANAPQNTAPQHGAAPRVAVAPAAHKP
jgi:RND family efflux transporter MFP subunit